jgi:hypothetical protein
MLDDLETLGQSALAALLAGHPVSITHEPGWQRPKGWPLPIKRVPDGTPQAYRPIAVLEFIDRAVKGTVEEEVQALW